MEQDHPLFKKDLLDLLPVYFRHMSCLKTSDIEEQYERVAFSSSEKHQAEKLLKHGSYKPISEIDLKRLQYVHGDSSGK